jgi:hypothetical protein
MTTDTVFAVILGGTKHNIVTSPSCVKQILNQRSNVSSVEVTYYLMEKFFGDRGAVRAADPETIFGPIHRQLFLLMREPFLTNATDVMVKAIEERTPNLISFADRWLDQTLWERGARLARIKGPVSTVEASLFPLVRNFVGDLASSVLMGHKFMENYPNLLEDLWLWDGKFNMYLLGLPSWMPGMKRCSQARERIRRAVQELEEALFAAEEGKDPGSKWSDLSDVSQVIINRAHEWKKANSTLYAYSAGDAAVLWVRHSIHP